MSAPYSIVPHSVGIENFERTIRKHVIEYNIFFDGVISKSFKFVEVEDEISTSKIEIFGSVLKTSIFIGGFRLLLDSIRKPVIIRDREDYALGAGTRGYPSPFIQPATN